MESRGQINKRAALSNILLKKDILLSWKENGIPGASSEMTSSDCLEYFPRSIRQFNAWDLSKNSDVVRNLFPGVKRNANDTLNNYPSIRLEISGLLRSLRSMSSLKRGKPERLVDKQKQIDESRSYISLLERELIQIRIERSDLVSQLKKVKSRDASIVGELKSVVSRLESEVGHLKRENSDLIATLAKIAPLREV
ncbi:TPA: hypothetical protein ACGW3Z_001619 [Pseudomonas aeruginosa]|uniref:hypothetical protein n=1 Tax=Pseudomonas aeruginosa group TaxID=136841 RepID=UPI0011B24780|nr:MULTISPECIES: hypothetical protein [Pseudomonas aeruginosa group]EKJ9725380.1 hypothetical protein [Pseudomonas aeruginosa]EKN0216396.1 hypothetical protein [Pseudomonas aeruginosa]EKT8168120.1 hypothetical protein [Pseudomonas aeruginosa]EKW8363631.1 hypothetical protein [Pseudomonas aeruginosa]MCR3764349.1 hypothetical protein [Pseudomonas aeruginosa]